MTREKKASITLELMMIGLTYRLNGNEMLSENEAARTRNAIDALDVAISYLLAEDNNVPAKQPDTITGLAPCGCGGKAKIWPSEPTQFTHVITDYEVGCTECAMTTGWVRGKKENAMKVWNTAIGYTAPPRPGAIVPNAGGMDPNGDEGARE